MQAAIEKQGGGTTQLNVRMDRELKKAGDAAFTEIGVTPSQVVRALWKRAAERGASLEQVKDLLENEQPAHVNEESKRRWKAMQATRSHVMETLHQIGVADPAAQAEASCISDEDALVEEIEERLRERGL